MLHHNLIPFRRLDLPDIGDVKEARHVPQNAAVVSGRRLLEVILYDVRPQSRTRLLRDGMVK